MITSVHPSGEPASILSARFHSAPGPGLTAAIARRSGSFRPRPDDFFWATSGRLVAATVYLTCNNPHE